MASRSLSAIELFAGAGGLSLGASWAGIRPIALFDNDMEACATLRRNAIGVHGINPNSIRDENVESVDFSGFKGHADILLAGAPCQPWSLAGSHRGPDDARNLFAHVVRAVAQVQPRAIVIENVQGLIRPKFLEYRNQLIEWLSSPQLLQVVGGDRGVARGRSGRMKSGGYTVYPPVLLNAADFGSAQVRQRVFIVAFRNDEDVEWSPPVKTHCASALIRAQVEDGAYWRRHGIKVRRIAEGRRAHRDCEVAGCTHEPWVTVRDCLRGLPDPRTSGIPSLQHVFVGGARTYPGHSGSDVDWPSKTIKAGVHGVPGGENTIRHPTNGRVRYLTVREAARLQDFPDGYGFAPSWSRAFRQIGNAVPVKLAKAVVESVARSLVNVKRVGAA